MLGRLAVYIIGQDNLKRYNNTIKTKGKSSKQTMKYVLFQK